MFILLVLCSAIISALIAFVILYLRFRSAHNVVVENAARFAARRNQKEKASRLRLN